MSEPDSRTASNSAHQSTTLIVNPQVEPQVNSNVIAGAVIVGMFLLGIVIAVFGWTLFLKVLLWGIVVACGLVATLSVILANDPEIKQDLKSGYWITAAVFALVAFAVWIIVPTGAPQSVKSTAIPSNPALSPQGQRTFEYWNRFNAAVGRGLSRQPRTPQEIIATCSQMAYEIDQLPATNIDPDAIRSGLALRTWLVALASETERRNSPGALVGAFIRGYQGDVFGPFLDESAATTALGQSLRDVQNQLVSARAILSSRYGAEFPRIQF